MNIETSNLKKTTDTQTQNLSTTNKDNNSDSSIKFADELKEISNNSPQKNEVQTNKNKENSDIINDNLATKTKEDIKLNNMLKDNNIKAALNDMNNVLQEFNQSEDKTLNSIKEEDNLADMDNMINNDFNIQENKDLLPQMNLNMNFSGDGQPFSSFMNNENSETNCLNKKLESSTQDLAEEAAILSTMAENIAIANKNQVISEKNLQKPTKIVMDEEGIKEVDVKTGIKTETIVKYDTIILNQADVEVFTNLVEKGEVNLNELAPKAAEKAVNVSKTLADMLAKSMETNQPLRINFDNDISVIIRISRDGKITADFLPSSQVAEAYLKENLPLLKQRFEDNNIEYDSLNQRERREQQKENNKKKDRNNE